jgi:hypothetical protein
MALCGSVLKSIAMICTGLRNVLASCSLVNLAVDFMSQLLMSIIECCSDLDLSHTLAPGFMCTLHPAPFAMVLYRC